MAFDPDPELDALLRQFIHPELKLISPGLERIHTLLEALGNPHRQLPPVIHIAGTNGKGSTLALLMAMLQAAGKRVHRYTSPHLVQFSERITVANQPITKTQLLPILQQLLAMQDEYPTTFFEATTIAALIAFSLYPADYVLLETGLGGRLDATNVIEQPLANIITPIGYDHQDYLGNTLTEIAREKAGILRCNIPAIIAPQEKEALQAILSHQPKADLFVADQDWHYLKHSTTEWEYRDSHTQWTLPLPALQGDHQIMNAATAIATLFAADISINKEQVTAGLQHAQWSARCQMLTQGYWRQFIDDSTPLILDGAHNALGAQQLVQWVREHHAPPPVVIVAMKSDKDIHAFLQQWKGQLHQLIALPLPGAEEGVEPAAIKASAQSLSIPCCLCETLEEALKQVAFTKHPILLTGSLYFAGAVLAKN